MPDLSLLNYFAGFWPQVWSSFLALSAVEQLTNALALLAPLGAVWGLGFRRLLRTRTSGLRDEIAGLEKQVDGLRWSRKQAEEKLAVRDAELKEMSLQLPAAALARAGEERKDGNEERAVQTLRDCFETLRPDVAAICVDLSLHHSSIAPDFGAHHDGEALRLAHMAMLMSPDDPEISEIYLEVLETSAQVALQASAYDPLDAKWDDARFFAHVGAAEESAKVFQTLVNIGKELNGRGLYRRSERLLRRARTIGNRVFGPNNRAVYRAAWPWLSAVDALGMAEQALAAATDIAANCAPSSQEFATATFYRSRALRSLGRYDEALQLIQPNVKLWKDLQGEKSRETSANRRLMASLLQDLKRLDEAMSEVEALLPIVVKVDGERSVGALRTRLLRASILEDAEKLDEALAETKELVELNKQINGAEHPNTLSARHLFASISRHMGQLDAALAEVDALLALKEKLNGAQDYDAAMTRGLRASILFSMGKYRLALEEVDRALAAFKERENPRARYARLLRVAVLEQVGEIERAHEEANALMRIIPTDKGNVDEILGLRTLQASLQMKTGNKESAWKNATALVAISNEYAKGSLELLRAKWIVVQLLLADGKTAEALGELEGALQRSFSEREKRDPYFKEASAALVRLKAT